MIIGIDAHNIRGNGGSLIHLKELLENCKPKEHKIKKIIIWINTESQNKLPQKSYIDYQVLSPKSSVMFLVWQKYQLEKEAKRKGCDILYFPGGIYLGNFKPVVLFSQSMLPFFSLTKSIYRFTLFIWILKIKKYLMLNSFKKAEGLIFVSEAIKKQVENVSKRTFNNSKVIHHGVSKIFYTNFKRENLNELVKKNLPVRILTVSSHAKHKNLKTLIEAISELRTEGKKLELKIVGPQTKYGTKELFSIINKIDANNNFIKVLSNEKYENLPNYYNEADLFIIPSKCESFGLPLKEAIVNGIPIIYNSLDSFNEIIENTQKKSLCLEFQNSKESLKNKILEILNKRNDGNFTDVIRSDLGWRKCATETFDFIEEVVAKNLY